LLLQATNSLPQRLRCSRLEPLQSIYLPLMSEPTPSKLIPKSITGYWLENEDFLSDYVLLKNWSPFEAACLINGIKPGAIVNGVTKVGIVPEELNRYDENPQKWIPKSELINLTKIILRNNDKKISISAKKLVEWAVETRQLHSKSYLAQILTVNPNKNFDPPTDISPIEGDIQQQLNEANLKVKSAQSRIELLQTELIQAKKNLKMTGKNHKENRLTILGAALNELALVCSNEQFTKNGRLVATQISSHLDEHRDLYNIPNTHGFSYENILATIRDSIKAAVKNTSE
jgi:hypothetical protein